jgi:hypothetical protein
VIWFGVLYMMEMVYDCDDGMSKNDTLGHSLWWIGIAGAFCKHGALGSILQHQCRTNLSMRIHICTYHLLTKK